jgi:transposase-like protein
MTTHHYTDTVRDAVIFARDRGDTFASIAARLGISPTYARRLYREKAKIIAERLKHIPTLGIVEWSENERKG